LVYDGEIGEHMNLLELGEIELKALQSTLKSNSPESGMIRMGADHIRVRYQRYLQVYQNVKMPHKAQAVQKQIDILENLLK